MAEPNESRTRPKTRPVATLPKPKPRAPIPAARQQVPNRPAYPGQLVNAQRSVSPAVIDWTREFQNRINAQVPASAGGGASTAVRTQAATGGGSAGGAGSSGGGAIQPMSDSSGSTFTAPERDNTYGYSGANVLRDPNAIKDNREWFAGRVANAAVPGLASDPEQISYQWAQANNYGRGVEGLLNSYADPYAIGLLSGKSFATDEDYLGFVGGFNDMALSGSTGNSPFDPRSALKRIFGASGQVNTDPAQAGENSTLDIIGQKLFGGQNATNVSGQVGETMKFLQASLTGVMSPVVLNAYLATINELGQAFLAYKNSPDGAKSPINFGQFILDRLGPNAGL